MAEQQRKRSQNGRRSGSQGKLSGREAIERVREELPALLGHPVDSILGLESARSNGWTVIAQVVELARVPTSTDVLGAYEVTLDSHGELIGAKQCGRYCRNQADAER